MPIMEEQEIDLRDYLKVIIKRKGIILGIFFSATIISIIVNLFFIAPTYEANSTLILTEPKYQVEMEPRIQTILRNQVSLVTYVTMLKDPTLIEKVSAELSILNPVYGKLKRENLNGMAKIETVNDTQLVKIKITAESPQKTVDIANIWAKIFVRENEKLTSKDTEENKFFIEEQLKISKENLKSAEEKLKNFEEKDTIKVTESEVDIALNKLLDYGYTLSSLHLIENEINSYLEQISELKGDSSSIALANRLFIEQIQTKLTNVSIISIGETSVKQTNRTTITREEVPQDMEQQITAMKMLKNLLKDRQKLLKENITDTKSLIDEFKYKLTNEKLKFDRLSRDTATSRDTYLILSKKYEEAKIEFATKNNLIKIASLAYPPEKPISPNKRRNVTIAGILGLLLGIFLVFFIEYLQPKTN